MIGSKNLVMGTSIGYNISQVKNFVLSFRKFNMTDSIIMLVDKQTQDNLREFFNSYYVTSVLFDAAAYATPCNNSRYTKYLDILVNNPQYKNVLISDTRDVVFQMNPFTDLPEDYLYCFEEDSNVSLWFEGNNRTWLIQIYGPERAEQLQNSRVMCSGTIFGSYDRMTKLVEAMVAQISYIHQELSSWQIVDQGVFNNICYSDLAEKLNITHKKNGDIVTTLCMSLSTIGLDVVQLNLQTNTLTVNGMTPKIIHQYDRNVILTDLYDKMYKI